MRALVNNSERFKNVAFKDNIHQFCIVFKDCMIKAKSTDMQVAQIAKEKLSKMQSGLGPNQKMMINVELKEMEKRSRRMT